MIPKIFKTIVFVALNFIMTTTLASTTVDYEQISSKNKLYFQNLEKMPIKSRLSILEKRLKIALDAPQLNLDIVNDIMYYFLSLFELKESHGFIDSMYSNASKIKSENVSSALAKNIMSLIEKNPSINIFPFLKEYILKFEKSSTESRFEVLSAMRLLFYNKESHAFYGKMLDEKNVPIYLLRNIKWQLLRMDIYTKDINLVQSEAKKLVSESTDNDDYLRSEDLFFRSLLIKSDEQKINILKEIRSELNKKYLNFWILQNYAKVLINLGEFKEAISVYEKYNTGSSNIEKSIKHLDILIAKIFLGEEASVIYNDGILFFQSVSSQPENNPYFLEFKRIYDFLKTKKYAQDKNINNYWSYFFCRKEKKCL